jgi:type VI protein secretion system component VasK
VSTVPRTLGDASTEAEPRPRTRPRRQAVARGAHRVITVLAIVGSLHALFLLGVETWRFVVERQAVAHLQGQVDHLRNQAQGLQQVIDHANDPRYREDLARRQGYMYPNEQRAVTQQPTAPASNAVGGAGSGP